MVNFTSAVFLPHLGDDVVVCGTSSGALYVYQFGKCIKVVPAHAKGPKKTMGDGSIDYEVTLFV